MTALYSPFPLRSLTLRNRIGVSPMCQYSSVDGFADDWHLVHLGSRAVGGAGMVMAEASGITAAGRISPGDLGIYDDRHVEMLARIAGFIAKQGAAPAIQLAHAGRKAATQRPWHGGKPLPAKEATTGPAGEAAWPIIGPSAIPYDAGYQTPKAADATDITALIAAFVKAAERALRAGFHIIEIHAAHGYLLHSFLSPLSNQRTDAYGGSLENRCRLLLEIVAAVRRVWPERLPLFVRLSCTDWMSGDRRERFEAAAPSWDIDETCTLAGWLKAAGVDVIDCSSGGLHPQQKITVGAGYQVPFAERVRRTGIPTAAVGMITEAMQADQIVRNGQADLVFMAREMLRDPYWPLRHARDLQVKDAAVPKQYGRAFG